LPGSSRPDHSAPAIDKKSRIPHQFHPIPVRRFQKQLSQPLTFQASANSDLHHKAFVWTLDFEALPFVTVNLAVNAEIFIGVVQLKKTVWLPQMVLRHHHRWQRPTMMYSSLLPEKVSEFWGISFQCLLCLCAVITGHPVMHNPMQRV